MNKSIFSLTLVMLTSLAAMVANGEIVLEPAVQAKVDAQIQNFQSWAKEPAVLKAVKDHNATVPADQAAMTQAKWETLTVLDPWVRAFTKNEVAVFLKTKKTESVGEIFVSGADGLKVAFLSKPTNWSHKNKPKHEVPMTGKTWQGPVELDESTGLQEVQVSVPVMDGDKPIGSIVIGLVVSKMRQ